MVLTWRQRGARVLGSFVLGFVGGIGALSPELGTQSFLILVSHAIIAGMITAGPQIKRVLDEYGKSR